MNVIIKKIQKGDEDAFKKLTQSIENDLYRVAKTRLNSDDDIKDAIQNTMIIIYEKAKKIRNIKYFKTWIIRVLINECSKIYNSNKRNQEIYSKAVTNYNLYEDSIQTVQNKMNFDSLIEKLNYEEKIVITLYYGSQFSCREISKILNTNVNTIKSRLTRGKNKLKNLYKEEY